MVVLLQIVVLYRCCFILSLAAIILERQVLVIYLLVEPCSHNGPKKRRRCRPQSGKTTHIIGLHWANYVRTDGVRYSGPVLHSVIPTTLDGICKLNVFRIFFLRHQTRVSSMRGIRGPLSIKFFKRFIGQVNSVLLLYPSSFYPVFTKRIHVISTHQAHPHTHPHPLGMAPKRCFFVRYIHIIIRTFSRTLQVHNNVLYYHTV